jgi:ribosome-associated protein
MDGIGIPENELSFSMSRSGGPGGQNVNKVSTKVTLSFDVRNSAALSAEQKRRVMEELASRINKHGILQMVSQRTRSRESNQNDVVARFVKLIRSALTRRPARIRTRVPAAVQQQRLDKKRKRGITKQNRSEKGWES